MKQLLTFFILLTFLAQNFRQAAIVADYYINTSSFIKNCENKLKPQLKCNGQCILMKKLRKEEKKDEQNPERKISYEDIVLSSKSYFTSLNLLPAYPSGHSPVINAGDIARRSRDIFHPPKA